MEFLKEAIDFVLHLDRHLGPIIQDYGVWTYLILFAVIFCETGLVVTPFLPGDSLLFAIGAIGARGILTGGELTTLVVLLIAAAMSRTTSVLNSPPVRIPRAPIAPMANSSESPGRKGVTTSPVSAKTMAKSTMYSGTTPM